MGFADQSSTFENRKFRWVLQDCDFSQESYLKLLDFQDTLYKNYKYEMVVNTSLTIIPELYPSDWQDKTLLCRKEITVKS